jgi:hypothetical protein
MAEGLEALLRSAQAALIARRQRRYPPPKSGAQKLVRRPSPVVAVSGAGAVAKTAVGVAGRLRRQWLRWLTDGARRCVRVRCDRWA